MSKQHWKKVTLGEVADNSTAATKDPFGDGYTRYVIGKHIPTDSSKITTWNEVGDGEFGSRIRTMFRAGDIICTTRGPNLRVAVPDFDGLCAHTNFILRTKDTNLLLQKYLEYVVSSDGFQNHLKLNFRGSTNLFVNWSDAAKYEFSLPPVDEQRRIADLLWAADDAIMAYHDLLTKAENLLNSKMREVMQNPNWKTEPLEKLATVERGKFAHRPRNLPQFYGGNYPFVQTGDIARCRGNLTTYDQTLSEEGKALSKSFPTGSIMMTIAAVIGKTAITTFETWATDSVVGIVPKNIDVHFLEFYLRTQQQHLDSVVATQTAQKNINLAVLRPLSIPVPSKEEQKEVASQLLEIQNNIESQEKHIEKSVELKKQLLNKMLSS